ncbi:MAG: SIMPL domain-containing protein [Patescibacteria group bacterium]
MTVVVLLGVFLAVISISTIKGWRSIGKSQTGQNMITISGTGEAVAIPDTAQFTFSVIESAKTTKEATDMASKKINAIIPALKALGVDEKDIKTVGYNMYPQYEYKTTTICAPGYCPPGKQVINGYEVNQSVSVKVRKTADAGTVLTKVTDLGASNVSGLDFVIDNQDTIQAEARDKAIQDAKNKANELSKSLGVRLTKIINFYETGNQPIYYDKMMSQSAVMGAGMAPSVAPELPVGENKVTSNVTITYEVE